jgi:hypothetical protein
MDPRSAPERIVPAHRANQLANFLRHGRTARFAASNFPGPEQAKALPMPSDDRGGFHDVDTRPPVAPHRREPRPQQSIRSLQLRPFDRALKDPDLVAQRKNLELERRTAPKRGGKRGDERGE